MKHILTLVFSLVSFCILGQNPNYVLLIHGGAGNFNSSEFSAELMKDYTETLNMVLMTGDSLLKEGATAIEAAVACVVLMENSPLFNAGKGAVFTEEGKNELDASIMDGKTLAAGAVAGVSNIKNPVTVALKVMEEGKHVMLSGSGAEKFAESNGLEIVDPSYFKEKNTYDRYLQLKKQGGGTVGAVVLDTYGNLAAATSTGGMMMKRFGRIGDSPVIGAGTYADNNWCAVSCTGHGEYFIRFVAAYDVVALMKYGELPVEEAAARVIDKIGEVGGTGGLIAVDKQGNIAIPFNTTSMFRAWIRSSGQKEIIF